MPTKWKLNRVTATACDPIVTETVWIDPIEGPLIHREETVCVYHVIWDVLLPGSQWKANTKIAAIESVCAAHAVSTAATKGFLRWGDGHWKPDFDYQTYERLWFLWLNNAQWKAKVAAGIYSASKPMPPEIANMNVEPLPPATVGVPPGQVDIDDMERVYGWNKNHMDRRESVKKSLIDQIPSVDMELVAFLWSGIGDTRVLHLDTNGQLNQNQQNILQAALDILHSPGAVVVEG